MSTGTIASRIEKLIVPGEEIGIDELVDIDKQEHIMSVMSIRGSEKLAHINEKLGDDYTYEEIRLVSAYKISNHEMH